MNPGEYITEDDDWEEVVDEYGNLKARILVGTRYTLWRHGCAVKTWYSSLPK